MVGMVFRRIVVPGLENRVGIFGRALAGFGALAVIATIDGHSDEAMLREFDEHRALGGFSAAGAVRDNHDRLASGLTIFHGFLLDEQSGYALMFIGRIGEVKFFEAIFRRQR